MTTEEKVQKLKAALDRFDMEVGRLKREHEEEVQKIFKEIDAAQIEVLKKQLGI